LPENKDEIKIAAGEKRDVFTSTLQEHLQSQQSLMDDEEEEVEDGEEVTEDALS
jgi:hypothetical protein